jgi:transcriptional regulator with XRE-family HTH domain
MTVSDPRVEARESEMAARVGARLRAAREDIGLSIRQLAEKTGLTNSFISQLERNRAAASLNSLVRICDVLGIRLSTLFEPPRVWIVRRDDRTKVDYGGTGIADFLLTPSTDGRIQVLETLIAPGGVSQRDYTLQVDLEVAIVLEGAIEFTIEMETILMNEGDALGFPGRDPHSWRNASDTEPARIVWVLHRMSMI